MASVSVGKCMGKGVWLTAGMMLICGGCMTPMSSPRPDFWRLNPILPQIGSAHFMFIDTAASTHPSSSNNVKGEMVLENSEPSGNSDIKQQLPASPKPIPPLPEIPGKEKKPPVPVQEVPEKAQQPPDRISEVPEKEKKPPVPVQEVPEKAQQPPDRIPEVPEKEKKPPILVPEVPEKVNGEAVVTYKTKIEETRDLIRVIDESRLNKEQHDTFNSIHSFLEKAQEAFSQDDMSMAVNLAEKAHTLAKEIVRNSP